ncbi:MAG: carbohydrate binding domain-containing protein [Spirochaetales bacterium]|nr:carbohydrate binding domain-containing protein [Spirochaetales bacterium]
MKRYLKLFGAIILLICFTACPPPAPDPENEDHPGLSLEEGAYYFSLDGSEHFFYGRNITGYEENQLTQILSWESNAAGRIARIHLTHGFGQGITAGGNFVSEWRATWDSIFDEASDQGISVIPVFGVWADWNNDGAEWSNWDENPLNSSLGGPADSPAELLSATETRDTWLGWVTDLVNHWEDRWNIAAWEIFSEVDLISGANETLAMEFAEAAGQAIKTADSKQRPVTASLCAHTTYTGFFNASAIDIAQIHPYYERLDEQLYSMAIAARNTFNKPVLIGESGLSYLGPEPIGSNTTTFDRAEYGIKHAIWAAMVSGAMNGRNLWWEDSYALYYPTLGNGFISDYENSEQQAAEFAGDVFFTDFAPVAAQMSTGIWGGVIGNGNDSFIGWVRDSECVAPDWPLRALTQQYIEFNVESEDQTWEIACYDPDSGTLVDSTHNDSINGKIVLRLPDFSDSLAWKMQPSAAASSGELVQNGNFTDLLAYWTLNEQPGADADYSSDGTSLLVNNITGVRDKYLYSGAKWDIALEQGGIALEQGRAYHLTFTASAVSEKNLSVVISENNDDVNGDGDAYSWYTPTCLYRIGPGESTYSFDFVMQYADNADALLHFALAESDTAITFASVSLTGTDYIVPAAGMNLLQNGDFSDGISSWDYWMPEGDTYNAYPLVESGELHYDINGAGSGPLIELSQAGIILENGKSYRLEYDAMAAAPRSIYLTIDENGLDHAVDGNAYTAYLAWTDDNLTTGMGTYTHEFTVTGLSDYNAKLKFYVGGSTEDVNFDNITLYEVP